MTNAGVVYQEAVVMLVAVVMVVAVVMLGHVFGICICLGFTVFELLIVFKMADSGIRQFIPHQPLPFGPVSRCGISHTRAVDHADVKMKGGLNRWP